MKRQLTIFLLIFGGLQFQLQAQNVGIGTSMPTHKLHIAGASNTLRVEGLASTGTFSTLPTAATDKILWADANGVIRSLAGGSAGYILGTNLSGAPVWINPVSLLNVGNGLYYNPTALKIHWGGVLTENTIVSQANYNTLFQLSGTGIFEVRNSLTAGNGLFVNVNDRVGIGTNAPNDKLEVGGSANTIRIGGVASTGTFNANTAASTDRILYTNTNGQLKSLPNGANGTVLSVSATGIPSWGSAADMVKVQNGLSKVTTAPNASASDPYIELGGTLLRNTTIAQGNFNYIQNLSGTGTFEVQDAGVSALLVDAAGNVVVNDAAGTRTFRVEGSTDANLIATDATNNRVGIGTNAPNDKLEVSGTANTIRVGGLANAATFSANTAASTDRLVYTNSLGQLKAIPNAVANSVLVIGSATSAPTWTNPDGLYWRVKGNTGTTAPAYSTTAAISATENYAGTTDAIDYVIGTNSLQRLRVTSNGKVAIGANNLSAAPTSQLYVESATANALELRNATTLNTGVSTDIYFRTLGATSYVGGIKTIGTATNAARMGFFTAASALSSDLLERMSIANDGNVGIGATSPQTKLEVNGALALRSSGTLEAITSGTQGSPQLITVGNRSYIRIGSNSAVASARAFALSDGLIEGQMLTIEYANADNNLASIYDLSVSGSNANLTSFAVVFGASNTYTRVARFIWNGTDWLQEGVGITGKASFVHTNGAQPWVVPAGIYTVFVKLWGAGGGANGTASSGGGGGYVSGYLSVTPGEVLNVMVGSGGGNGTYGGAGNGSNDGARGGGRSAIQRNGSDIVTAGGGGGAADDDGCGSDTECGISTCRNGYGGAGGGLTGGSGGGGDLAGCGAGDRGNGGSQVAGGNANSTGSGGVGASGAQYVGGTGGAWGCAGNTYGGGGGGGGWYGGSGGSASCGVAFNDDTGGGGGGGSNYVGNLTGAVVNGQGFSNTGGGWAAPANTTDVDYQSGIGYGASSSFSGDNGKVVIIW